MHGYASARDRVALKISRNLKVQLPVDFPLPVLIKHQSESDRVCRPLNHLISLT